MQVPFLDLTVPTEQVKEDFLTEVKKFLDEQHFILGKKVEEFEEQWAKIIGTKYCVGLSSGADALYLSLLAVGVKPGDEVITQGNAYNATVTAILRVGAIPVFADINENSLTIDPQKIEPLISEKTRAILPVHLYGQANDMTEINKIAEQSNLVIVEDCAQAHLAESAGKKVGSWGKVGAFSYYPTKNLGAFGDAGAVTTNDETVYQELLTRRNLGQVKKNDHQLFGLNHRLDSIQAIALSLKLKYLDENTKSRQEAARYYDELISSAGIPIQPVKRLGGESHVYHLYVVQSLRANREELQEQLKEYDIETAVHYPNPVYRQGFYEGAIPDCPVTDLVQQRIFSLPLFIGITKGQQEYVVASLKKIIMEK